jgi:hypothetical protein
MHRELRFDIRPAGGFMATTKTIEIGFQWIGSSVFRLSRRLILLPLFRNQKLPYSLWCGFKMIGFDVAENKVFS